MVPSAARRALAPGELGAVARSKWGTVGVEPAAVIAVLRAAFTVSVAAVTTTSATTFDSSSITLDSSTKTFDVNIIKQQKF